MLRDLSNLPGCNNSNTFFNQNIIGVIDYCAPYFDNCWICDDKFSLNYKMKIILFIIISFLYNTIIFSEFDNIGV